MKYYYKFRGNGYGPFDSLKKAGIDWVERVDKIENPLFKDVAPTYYYGAVKVNKDRKVTECDLVKL